MAMDTELDLRIKTVVEAGESAKSLGELKASLRELQNLSIQYGEKSPEAMAKVTAAAGKIKDKIGDLRAETSALSGEGFENVANSANYLKSSLTNLSFSDATQGVKLLTTSINNLKFNDLSKSVGDFGKSLLTLGKALLTNPLFLLGSVIALIITNFDKLATSGGLVGKVFTAIGDAVGYVVGLFTKLTDAIGLTNIEQQKSIDKQKEATDKAIADIDRLTKYRTEKLAAQGKSTLAAEKEGEDAKKKVYDTEIKIIEDLEKKDKAAFRSKKDRLEELRKLRQGIINNIDVLEIKVTSEKQKKEEDLAKKRKENYNEYINQLKGQWEEYKRIFADIKANQQSLSQEKISDFVGEMFKFLQGKDAKAVVGDVSKALNVLRTDVKNLLFTTSESVRVAYKDTDKFYEDILKVSKGSFNEELKIQYEQLKRQKIAREEKYKEDKANLEIRKNEEILAIVETSRAMAKVNNQKFDEIKATKEAENILYAKYYNLQKELDNNFYEGQYANIKSTNEIKLKMIEDGFQKQIDESNWYIDQYYDLIETHRMSTHELFGVEKDIEDFNLIKDEKLKILDAEMNAELQKADITGANKELITRKYAVKIKQVELDNLNDITDAMERQSKKREQLFSDTYSSLRGISDALSQNELNNATGNEAKLKEARKRQFNRNKLFNSVGAIMNTYQGITKAIADYPYPLSVVMAGLAGALGFAQVAAINSQRFDEGGNSSSSPMGAFKGSGTGTGGASSAGAGSFAGPSVFSTGFTGQMAQGGPMRMRVSVLESDITKVQDRVRVQEQRSNVFGGG